MKNFMRPRRWAETVVILGLCLMAVTAVSWADGPASPSPMPVMTPAPTPTETPTAAADPTPAPTAAMTPGATATAVPTVGSTPVATATPAAAATPAATATATATPTAAPSVAATVTPAATPELLRSAIRAEVAVRPTRPPSASPVPAEALTGAALTLCHYIGDPDQPYVAVTVSADQYSPHFDDELDIIPAPSSGCDNITDPDAAASGPVLLCHATGNPSQPFLLVALPNGDLGGHEVDLGDLIPAPDGTCPGLEGGAYGVPTATPTPTATATATAMATPQPAVLVRGLGHRSSPGRRSPGLAGAAGTTGAPTTIAGRRLPLTGFDLWVLFAIGSGFVMAGGGLRVLSRQTA